MTELMAGRVIVSNRLQSPSRTRNQRDCFEAAIPRAKAQERKPGTRTNGSFRLRDIQIPRAREIRSPKPERPVGNASCQSGARRPLMAMVGALVRIPALIPPRTEYH